MNDHLTNEARLTEIGRLLALGALRMLQEKHPPRNFASKTLLASKENPWLIEDGREKFEGEAS